MNRFGVRVCINLCGKCYTVKRLLLSFFVKIDK